MRILTHTVLPEEEGRMVKGILRGSLQLSYTLLKSLKWRENAILLNGQSVHVNAIVHAGDVVSVALSERTPREDLYCENTAAPNIVYEDEDLLVLNKPAGTFPQLDHATDTVFRRDGDFHRVHEAVFSVVYLPICNRVAEILHCGVGRDGAIFLLVQFLQLVGLDLGLQKLDGIGKLLG